MASVEKFVGKHKEKDLLDLLEIIILKMMLTEKIENFQIENHYNKQMIKQVIKKSLDVIVPTAERDYKIIFDAGEQDVHGAMREYEKLVGFIRDFNVPQKEKLTEMIECYNYDKKVMDATMHRLIKKQLKENNHV